MCLVTLEECLVQDSTCSDQQWRQCCRQSSWLIGWQVRQEPTRLQIQGFVLGEFLETQKKENWPYWGLLTRKYYEFTWKVFLCSYSSMAEQSTNNGQVLCLTHSEHTMKSIKLSKQLQLTGLFTLYKKLKRCLTLLDK